MKPEKEVPHTSTQRPADLICLGIIMLAGIACYVNTFTVPFQFDDVGISNSYSLFSRLSRIGARYATDLTFALNHKLNGQSVAGYHVINLSIHLTTACALYMLVSSLIRSLFTEFTGDAGHSRILPNAAAQWLPAAVAVLFVVHPVQTQAVTYIAQRYTSQAALFYITTVWLYIQARSTHAVSGRSPALWAYSAAGVITGILAMFSKENAITLPVALLLTECFVFRGKLLKNKLFLLLLVCLMIIIPAQHLVRHGGTGLDDLAYTINRSSREELTYSRADYLITELRVISTYIRLLVLPVDQNLDYDFPLLKRLFAPQVLLSLLLHLSLLSYALYLFVQSSKKLATDKHTEGVCLRLASFGIVWFYLTLMVESSIIPIVDVIFEHRLYLPSAGGILAITALAAPFALKSKKTAWTLLSAVVVILGCATYQRNTIWNSDVTLWEDTARKSPNKSRVLNNLATVYLSRGMTEKAVLPLIRAVELQPGAADGLNNLGVLLDQLPEYAGRYTNGQQFLNRTKNVDMRYYNTWFANTQNNLGLVYDHIGNHSSAVTKFRLAAVLDPRNEHVWHNMYISARKLGNTAAAQEALDKLKSLNPYRAAAVVRPISAPTP